MQKEQMNIVIVGNVDHGKSTVIGRLLADTDSLPKGKLEQVKKTCADNARPFEYAFLLDALKDEQAQGITIDTARCFFKTKKRDYIVHDAPGHIEFLKNMVTGAARAEAALLVIDAHEGIQENSKRHGYLISMLGIKQVAIVVNKMDLVNYDQKVFERVKTEYSKFLKQLDVEPLGFIPISAREGHNITELSDKMSWYKGSTILGQLETFKKRGTLEKLPFRFPVQDIYKFTASGDDRRIVAGTIETGQIKTGEEIVFLPSMKKARINSIECFNVATKNKAIAGEAIGLTLDTEIYIKSGEMIVKAHETQPHVSQRFKANIFWMGRAPLIKNKTYKLKLASSQLPVRLVDIDSIIDASELESIKNKKQIDRHDVAVITLETAKPLAYDLASDIDGTGRFVLVDNYEIAGGGIILETLSDEETILKQKIREREYAWEKSAITNNDRSNKYDHRAKFILLTGEKDTGKQVFAKALEKELFDKDFKVYYLGISNIVQGLERDIYQDRDEHIRRLGELARIMTDSGQIFITTISNIDDYDLEKLKLLNEPNEIIVVNVGENIFNKYQLDLNIEANEPQETALPKIIKLLREKEIIIEYNI